MSYSVLSTAPSFSLTTAQSFGLTTVLSSSWRIFPKQIFSYYKQIHILSERPNTLSSVFPSVNKDGTVLGGDQAGAEALGHAGLKGHERAGLDVS